MIDCNFYRFIDNNPRGKFEPAASDLQTLLVFFQHPACVITPVNLVESAVFCTCLSNCHFLFVCVSVGHSATRPPHSEDEVAEWLRPWTANPMSSARVGSNPILFFFYLFIFYYFIAVKLSWG